jgi:hypothetical protein
LKYSLKEGVVTGCRGDCNRRMDTWQGTEKGKVAEVGRKIVPGSSLPCSQQLGTGPYTKPDESSPHILIPSPSVLF